MTDLEMQEKLQDLEALLAVFHTLYRSATADMTGLLALIVEKAIGLAGADRGCLLFITGDKWFIKVALDNRGVKLPPDEFRLSQTVITNTLSQQKALAALDTQADADLAGRQSIVDLGIRLVVTVPIVAGERVVAMLYLDSASPRQEAFSERRLQTLRTFAEQVALALAQAQLFNEVRSLPRRLVAAQEAERARLARELHDESGQAMAAMLMNLRVLEQELTTPDEAVIRLMTGLRQGLHSVSENLHRLAADLRPATLDYLGLAGAVRQYIESLQQHGLNVTLKVTGFDDDRLPAEVETNLYRIIQEALTNAIKHSRASRIEVSLERGQSSVKATVTDNGVGFEAGAVGQNRLGLAGLRERAEVLNGTLTVKSLPGKGTMVQVEVANGYSRVDSR